MTITPKATFPFWRYYGGKWRAAPRYPFPRFNHIIEPFAGAAGYALRYAHLNVTLVDCYPVIAEIWRFLIGTTPEEVLRIPTVEHIDDLPGWVSQGARWLVGFAMNAATTSPRKQLSAGCKRLAAAGSKLQGWSAERRQRVALQVPLVKHWKIIEGQFFDAPIVRDATYFVDPPYSSNAGRYYKYSHVGYVELGEWCQRLPGFVIVCENEGATWLPFRPFATFRSGISRNRLTAGSKEVIWTKDENGE